MDKSTIDKVITCMLTPLSWIYGGVMSVRNMLFDKNLIRQEEFDIPVVCIGNLSVGGTGKTPHVEYIVNQLGSEYKLAILSRGYKRKTRGFVLANSKSTPDTIGDEPYQIYRKFGMISRVAVCENRTEGIHKLLELFPDINMVLLDDAFQHRFVRPKVSILLSDYSRPIYKDKIMPLGRLRESINGVNRADFVVVTKCPRNLQPIDYRLIGKEFELMPYQKLFFSRYEYMPLRPVFPDENPYTATLEKFTQADTVLLLTGIAHPRDFVRHFREYPFRKRVMHFADHHDFSRQDLERLENTFNSLTGDHKIILTTEKDAVRLSCNPYFPEKLKKCIYYQPISVRILDGISDDDFIVSLREAVNKKQNPLSNKYL